MKYRLQDKRSTPLQMAIAVLVVCVLSGVGMYLLKFGSAEAPPVSYYVTTEGTANNDGSKAHPWNLQTALSKSTVVKPGDTIWLRDGVYGTGGSTSFTSTLNGTVDRPIIIRGYAGERPTVDGSIIVNGTYNWYWGFEVTNSLAERTVTSGSRLGAFSLYGLGSKVINMVIHDSGHPGIGFWRTVGDGGEIYGSLIWGTGYYDANNNGNPRGSPIYAQNQVGKRLIQDNITFRNFTTSMKAYSENSYSNGFTIDGNIAFNGGDGLGLFVESKNPIDKTVVTNNYLYEGPDNQATDVTLGLYNSTLHGDLIFQNNYMGLNTGSGFAITSWKNTQATNNTVISKKGSILRIDNKYLDQSTLNIDHNTYVTGGGRPFQDTELQKRIDAVYSSDYIASTQTIDMYRNGRGTVSGSKNDRNSSFSTDVAGVKDAVFIRPNKYEPGRANIAVYNWENKPTVGVDLSSVLQKNQAYSVVDAQNYYGKPLVSGTYSGGSVAIPMTTTDHAALIGNVTTIPDVHTTPEFGSFVVLPQAGGSAPASPTSASRPNGVTVVSGKSGGSAKGSPAKGTSANNPLPLSQQLSADETVTVPSSQTAQVITKASGRSRSVTIVAVSGGLGIGGMIFFLIRKRRTQQLATFSSNQSPVEIVPGDKPDDVV